MTIGDLYELACNTMTNKHIIIDLGVVEYKMGAKILSKSGIEVTGFVISIDTYGIRHAVERHGDSKTELTRGQVPVQKSDFFIALEIVLESDNLRYDFRGNLNHSNLKESIVFDKKINDYHYFVSMEVRRVVKRGKHSRLVFQTMYIKKIATP